MSEEVEELIEDQQPEAVEQTEEEEKEEYNKVFFADENEAPEEEPEPEAEVEPEEPEPEEQPEPEAEGEPEPEAEEETPEEQPEEELVTLKWRGKEIKATQQEVINLAQQNFDATHKWQEASDMKKKNKADYDLLERARSGDKQAIAQIVRESEIDPVDLIGMEEDTEQGTATPAEPFISPQVAEMLDEVQQDTELFSNLQEIEHDLPQSVIDVMAKKPETFYAIVQEVQSGDAKIVMPEVQKAIALMSGVDKVAISNNPDAYANLYINVKNQMIQASQQSQQEQPEPKQKKSVPANELSVKKSGGQGRRVPKDVNSFTSDEAYQAILDRLDQQ